MEDMLQESLIDRPSTSPVRRSRAGAGAASARKKSSHRVTLNLPIWLVEQLRNAVYWTPGMTLASLVRDALHESLERMEQSNGARYPPRLAGLRSGRPRKTATRPTAVLSLSMEHGSGQSSTVALGSDHYTDRFPARNETRSC